MVKFNLVLVAACLVGIISWFQFDSFFYATFACGIALLTVVVVRYGPSHFDKNQLEKISLQENLNEMTRLIKEASEILVSIGYADFDHNKTAQDIQVIESDLSKVRKKSLLPNPDLFALNNRVDVLKGLIFKIIENLKRESEQDQSQFAENSFREEKYE